MLTNQLAVTYAQAIYELASEKGMLEAVEKQLRQVEETVKGHEDLATLLYHPRVPVQAKKETINRVFGMSLADFVKNFLLLLVDKRRETALPAIVSEYVKLANKARNIIEAEVISAMELTVEQEQQLIAKLAQTTGHNVIIKTAVDASLIGGVIVKIGDKLIDGSVARQLKAMEEALRKTQVTKIGVTS